MHHDSRIRNPKKARAFSRAFLLGVQNFRVWFPYSLYAITERQPF